MRYLIDGYNLLFRVLKKKGVLEQDRRMLIEELNEAISELHLNVTLIFDGAKDALPPTLRSHFRSIALVYTTEGQSADDYILEEISQTRLVQQMTIVTNDRELKRHSLRLGTKTLYIDEFLQLLLKRKYKKKQHTLSKEEGFRDSEKEMSRLLKIFEGKLREKKED